MAATTQKPAPRPARPAARPRSTLGVARMVPIRGDSGAPARFDHACPDCGRALRVRMAYAGEAVICRRCEHRFVAAAPGSPGPKGAPRPGGPGPLPPYLHAGLADYLASRFLEVTAENLRLRASELALKGRLASLRGGPPGEPTTRR